MKIEVLFPEFANLFGDCWNWKYLSRCMPEASLSKPATTTSRALLPKRSI